LRFRKSKLSHFNIEKETEMKSLEKQVAIYSAKIMQINNDMVANKIDEDPLSKLSANIHTISEAKHTIKVAVKSLEYSIKEERKAKTSVTKMRNEYLHLKKMMSELKKQKVALSNSFERKLMQIQNDHEDHMSLILDQVTLPVPKSNVSTEMTPRKNSDSNVVTAVHNINYSNQTCGDDVKAIHFIDDREEHLEVDESLSGFDNTDKYDEKNKTIAENLDTLIKDKRCSYQIGSKKTTKKNQHQNAPSKSTACIKIYEDVDSPPAAPSSRPNPILPNGINKSKNRNIKSSLNIQMPSMAELRNIISKGKSTTYMSKAMKRKEQFSYQQLHERKEALQNAKKNVIASRRETSRVLKPVNR